MALPRSDSPTKGIVPCYLTEAQSKFISFSLHNLIEKFLKYFEGKGYLIRRFLFFDDICIDLGNERQSGGMW